ncbi:hypothetical protein ACP4OV_017654 [Aristida adscensionis]
MVAAAAAAAGRAPAQTVNTAQTVAAAAAGMAPQAAADFGDVSAGQDMTGYYPREASRAGYHSLRDDEAIGASYVRYLRNGMPSVGANDRVGQLLAGWLLE